MPENGLPYRGVCVRMPPGGSCSRAAVRIAGVTSEGAASRISMHDWMTGWVPSTLLLLITLSRVEMSRERRHATSAGPSLALLAQIY